MNFKVTLNSTIKILGETFTVNDNGSIATFGGYGLADDDENTQDWIAIDTDYEIATFDADEIENNDTEFTVVITDKQIAAFAEYRKQYPATIIRTISPHKGDASGKRSQRMEARLTEYEKDRLQSVISALNLSLADYIMSAVEQDEKAGNTDFYEISSEYLGGDTETCTLKQVQDIVSEWEKYDGWDLIVRTSGDEIRVYADAYDDEPESLPTEWHKITDHEYYLIVARLADTD